MERGATANCVFSFPESVDFGNIEAMRLYVYGAASRAEVVKELSDVTFLDGNRAAVLLTQEDTIRFRDKEDVRLQWHWREKDGTARTSKVIEREIAEFLGSEPV